MFIPFPMHSHGEFEEGAEKGRAIIVHQLDQPGFLHQAAFGKKLVAWSDRALLGEWRERWRCVGRVRTLIHYG